MVETQFILDTRGLKLLGWETCYDCGQPLQGTSFDVGAMSGPFLIPRIRLHHSCARRRMLVQRLCGGEAVCS